MNEIFNTNWQENYAAVFRSFKDCVYLHPVSEFDKDVQDLLGLEEQICALDSNTLAFLEGKSASNALLWGARGCGKSSVVKFVLQKYLFKSNLRVIELDSKDILVLPLMLDVLREKKDYRFIIFCDDFSFHANQKDYKSIKSTLEGSLEKWAQNVLIYATSNIYRILENDSIDLSPEHSKVEESFAFGDRFGLRIGFYTLGTQEFLQILSLFLQKAKEQNQIALDSSEIALESLLKPTNKIRLEALNFATKSGTRNARVARDFVRLYANVGILGARK